MLARMNAPSITQREFGVLPDGRPVHETTLDNGRGLALSVINLGGIVSALRVPDRGGRIDNVVLGFSALADYVERNPNFGVLVGRYANRIAGGCFVLDGQTFTLPQNDGSSCLHGGPQGFARRWWQVQPDGDAALLLRYHSADGEQGFPGAMDVTVRYALGSEPGWQMWQIDYEATCDRATVVNLSQHSYFNLAGGGSALDHRLMLAASRYTPVDARLIPRDVVTVQDTPFDFRHGTRIGERIRHGHEQLALARGYDHNWVLDRSGPGLALAARLEEPGSGRVMELHTTEPALQFYAGNQLTGSLRGAGGELMRQGDGLCLEPQHYPDAPNRPDFPSTVLRPGEVYRSRSVYRFGVL